MQVFIIKPRHLFARPFYRLIDSFTLFGITVPAGFVTDGATVPRFLWPIFLPIGPYLEATVLHDFLIVSGVNRFECDRFFLHAMQFYKVGKFTRRTLFAAVVVYGFLVKPRDYLRF